MIENEKLMNALSILETLNNNGYEAYIVGGYVRDRLLANESNDIDITTNALPDVIVKIFDKTYFKNKKFKTVSVVIDEYEYEITTYRTDIRYRDHRHPQSRVSSSLKKDLKRRDFSVNALCMDKELNVIDLLGGKKDLDDKIIRAIGSPYRRFNEDALRMFRAFRFASRLNFKIEEKTYKAIKRHSSLIRYLSKERVREELEGLLKSKYLEAYIPQILESNILKTYPMIKKAFTYLELSYKELDFISFMAFVSYLDKDVSKELLLSRKEKKQIVDILNFCTILLNKKLSNISLIDTDIENVYRAINILKIFKIDLYNREDIDILYQSMPIKYSKDLNINGDDLKYYLDIKESPDIKRLLDEALKAVVDGECDNEKNEIVTYLKYKD